MREIKFRAWDKKKKEWFIVDEHERDEYLFTFDGRIVKVEWAGSDSWTKDVSDEFVVVQSTGLNDKNGKDIYEGNILLSDEERSGEVKFYNGSFILMAEPIGMIGVEFFWEIIGNIYETPELLEKK